MNTYVILRRDGWRPADDLSEAAGRSTAEGETDGRRRPWIRSYVLDESDGSVGTVCIYQASSPEAIRAHAAAADLPSTRSSRSRHGDHPADPVPAAA